MLATTCPLCSSAATPCLKDRPDYEFAVPERLDYHRCSGCGLVFADPIPEHKVSSFYVDYTTHGGASAPKVGALARMSRRMTLREFAAHAQARPGASILDYGCGDGSFLTELKALGYSNIVGYDFDPQAREAARATGFAVPDAPEELKVHAPFDVITLNHVIEHLITPADDLNGLASMLVPGGRIILRTPNAHSILSRRFGASWRGWETPRHLHVYTPAAMHLLATKAASAGLELKRLTTSQAMFIGIFHGSAHEPKWHRPAGKVARHAAALLAFLGLTLLSKLRPVGEELVVVLHRPQR